MTSYEEKQAAKKQRLEDAAAKAEMASDTANEMTVCVYEAHASKLFAVWIDLPRGWIGDA